MIRCKVCKKFARIERVIINQFRAEVVSTIGSCVSCGYENQENMVDYDDFEELGIDM